MQVLRRVTFAGTSTLTFNFSFAVRFCFSYWPHLPLFIVFCGQFARSDASSLALFGLFFLTEKKEAFITGVKDAVGCFPLGTRDRRRRYGEFVIGV